MCIALDSFIYTHTHLYLWFYILLCTRTHLCVYVHQKPVKHVLWAWGYNDILFVNFIFVCKRSGFYAYTNVRFRSFLYTQTDTFEIYISLPFGLHGAVHKTLRFDHVNLFIHFYFVYTAFSISFIRFQCNFLCYLWKLQKWLNGKWVSWGCGMYIYMQWPLQMLWFSYAIFVLYITVI